MANLLKKSPLRALHTAILLGALISLVGCAQDPLPSAEPKVVEQDMITLPKPAANQHELDVGVYNCIDTSGQHRPTGSMEELSSAVPLDCTPYLVQAVRELTPGYMFLVERQHVDELLRERQIATLALNENTVIGPDGHPHPAQKLSHLRVAEVLLIGQVVAYDRETRQITGGLAYGGAGITGEVVTDMVTFSLRAVAVQTGQILGQTTVTKSITSQEVGGHLTRVWPTEILDAELGGGTNEAVGLALQRSVRTALAQLVKQGLQDGWWKA